MTSRNFQHDINLGYTHETPTSLPVAAIPSFMGHGCHTLAEAQLALRCELRHPGLTLSDFDPKRNESLQ